MGFSKEDLWEIKRDGDEWRGKEMNGEERRGMERKGKGWKVMEKH